MLYYRPKLQIWHFLSQERRNNHDFLATLALRLVLLAAIWQVHGWIPAVILFLILGVTARTHIPLRLAIELGVLVLGTIAANAAWGTTWAAILCTAYIVATISPVLAPKS